MDQQPIIMIDLETLSLSPDARILAIGAVDVFRPHREFVSYVKNYDWGNVSKSTLQFWQEQDPELRNRMFGGETLLSDALTDLTRFIPSDALVMGNGADFDLAILHYHYDAMSYTRPWTYRNTRCFRTILAQAKDLGLPKIEAEIKHDPLSDAHAQAKALLKIAEHRPWVLT